MSFISKIFSTSPAERHTASPVQLRAYERLALLLERTTPEAIIGRIDDLTSLTPQQIEKQLLQTIRLEFDHNITQQIYVSNELWRKIQLAQAQMTAFVVAISKQVPSGVSGVEYAKALATAYHSNGDTPHELALAYLKEEVKELL